MCLGIIVGRLCTRGGGVGRKAGIPSRAALGCFMTLDPTVTPAATRDLTVRGLVPVGDVAYSRLQLWSIAEHLEQRPAVLPLMADPYAGRPLQPRFL